MARRWWRSKDGREVTTMRIEVTVTRKELELLEDMAKHYGSPLPRLMAGCFGEGLDNLGERYSDEVYTPARDEEEEDEA